MLRRALIATPPLLIATLAAAAIWLARSEDGLQRLIKAAIASSAGQLQIEQASGRLIGPLDIKRLRWDAPEWQIEIEDLHLDWNPGRLFQQHLHISELRAARVHFTSPSQNDASSPPADLSLPFAVDVDKLLISAFAYGNTLTTGEIAGQLHSDGRFHQLLDLRAQLADTMLTGEARLDSKTPFPLTASATLNSQLDRHPLTIALKADGPLDRLTFVATATQGIEGEAEIILTPFASTAFASARIALANIDPAAWQQGAPAATLSLRSEISPTADGIAGHFSLNNHRPGPLDRERLPLSTLDGQLTWQGETARLSELKLSTAGKGELRGKGQWQNGTLDLDLMARNLDVAGFAGTLRSTRLNGPISARIASNRQSVRLDLRDEQFALRGEASHAGDEIALPALELVAGKARLTAKGALRLNQGMDFHAEGELSRFDPSRFMQVPAAHVNARFHTTGKLQPRPLVDARFDLKDSQMAGQSFAGHGQLRVDWPAVPLADIHLVAGPNRLDAKGAFGHPGDVLAVDLDAPQLALHGLEGNLSGHLELSGSAAQPQLNARLQSSRLGHAALGRATGLSLTATLGGEAVSPLRIDLLAGQLDTPDQTALLSALHVQVEGTNQSHRLDGSFNLGVHTQLRLAATGGLGMRPVDANWQGQLLEASVNTDDKNRNLRLAAPAPLHISRDSWSIGPARLAGESLDWQATLSAAADAKQLNATLTARGKRLGLIDSTFSAGMQGPFALAKQLPWQGSLRSDINDLAWLGESFGDAWRTEGRLKGELHLLGKPDAPLVNGQFRGDQLALRLRDQGMNLVNGELAVELESNLLRISKLRFDSLLQAPPRALRLGAREDVAAMTSRPGRLEISGEMRVDRNSGADNAFLDIQLDRFGAWQLPEQWIALTGDGRLTWQQGAFGARGKLAVDAGYWQLAERSGPTLSDDVVIKRPGKDKQPISLQPKLDLDISAELGRNFLFKGAGLSSRLVGDVRLRASGRDLPRASGSIRTRDGRFDAYGQQLDIERGVMTFQGLLDNPALDIVALRKGLPVEAGVKISGTARKPVIKLTSDPELPEAEKLAWLILGHGPDQMGAGDATVLLAAAGGLLGTNSSNVVQELKKTFSIDEVGIRQGDIGGSGSRQPSSRVAGSTIDTTAATGNQIFSVGKRLAPNALLTYEQSLSSAESVVKLTVNLTRQLALIGRAGSDNALDIFYTVNFGKAPKKPR